MIFKRTLGACAVGAAMSMLGMLPGPASAQEKLVVWWTKGFYPAEDKALNEMIQRFERRRTHKSSCRSMPCRT
jgi:multiple sugar transport system substrate-binding protein